MRLIDADALTDEVMERYCKECDKRKGIKNGKYRIVYEIGDAPCRAYPLDDVKDELDNAPTIEPEPSIPISWIERRIDWLKDMDNGFANITAMNFEIMLRKWREEQNETD